VGRSLKSPRLRRFKSDRDKVRHGCSTSKYASIHVFDMTSRMNIVKLCVILTSCMPKQKWTLYSCQFYSLTPPIRRLSKHLVCLTSEQRSTDSSELLGPKKCFEGKRYIAQQRQQTTLSLFWSCTTYRFRSTNIGSFLADQHTEVLRYTLRVWYFTATPATILAESDISYVVCVRHMIYFGHATVQPIYPAVFLLQCRHCPRRCRVCTMCRIVYTVHRPIHGLAIFHQVLWTLLQRFAGFQVLIQ